MCFKRRFSIEKVIFEKMASVKASYEIKRKDGSSVPVEEVAGVENEARTKLYFGRTILFDTPEKQAAKYMILAAAGGPWVRHPSLGTKRRMGTYEIRRDSAERYLDVGYDGDNMVSMDAQGCESASPREEDGRLYIGDCLDRGIALAITCTETDGHATMLIIRFV